MSKDKIITERDMEIFINSTLNPCEPNEKLKEAVERYHERLKYNRGHGIKIGIKDNGKA